ncbi:Uncharacterized protein TPAR_00626 [Tolypocladium paradoxum]|uniref:Uncharacterized protein n=1 Tax=Tolypocladium paradoxum TaxID=94208 RepID=A0A2S4L9S6_9HYPO|nr:Uncharacterized protein TPAR_00626 [Tolypocladium paradoxum]
MDDLRPSGPCEPASLPPPVPPLTFEFTRIRAPRAPKPKKTRHAPYPLLLPYRQGEQGLSPPEPPRTTTAPYRVPMNTLVQGMNRQTLHTFDYADQDRMQELVRDQSDMIMDVDPDEVEAKEAPLPPMARSFEMMRIRRKRTSRGRPVPGPWHSSEDAGASRPEQPSPTTRHAQNPTTEPSPAPRQSPLEVGPEEMEAKEAPLVPTLRSLKLMPSRCRSTRRGRPLTGPWHLFEDARPRPEEPSPTTRHAQNATLEPLPAIWRSQPPVAVDAADDSACLDLEPDEGYCEGGDDMSWLGAASMLMGGLPTNGRLRFRTSAEAAMQCSVVVQKNPRMRRRRQRKMDTRLRASSTVTDASFDTYSSSMMLEAPEVLDPERPFVEPVAERISSDVTTQDGTGAVTTTGHDEH